MDSLCCLVHPFHPLVFVKLGLDSFYESLANSVLLLKCLIIYLLAKHFNCRDAGTFRLESLVCCSYHTSVSRYD